MYHTSGKYKEAINKTYFRYKARVVFDDFTLSNNLLTKIEIDSILVGGNDFEIGTVPMTMVDIGIIKDDTDSLQANPEGFLDYKYEGKEFRLEIGLEIEKDVYEYVPMGYFKAEEVIEDRLVLTLKCVDRMWKTEKKYLNTLTYPVSIKAIFKEACSQAGLEYKSSNFTNSDLIVENEPVFDGMMIRDVLSNIAELAGGYCVINRQGELEIINLGLDKARNITRRHLISLKEGEEEKGKIDKLIVKVGEETAERGEGENIYTIVNNLFIQNPELVIENIWKVLENIEYRAFDVFWSGDPSLDLGDKVELDGDDSFILRRNIKFLGSYLEKISAPLKTDTEKSSLGQGSILLDIDRIKTELRLTNGRITLEVREIEDTLKGLSEEEIGSLNLLLKSDEASKGTYTTGDLGAYEIKTEYTWTDVVKKTTWRTVL